MTIRIHTGDCRERLAELPADSVHCVVTSPPYFGLRDYGTAQWDGGDPGCAHVQSANLKQDSSGGVGGGRIYGTRGEQPSSMSSVMQYRDTCGKCGAVRIDSQIGLEPTLAAYIATLVDVFREVRRVLRPDGTCWLNLGDSYAGGGRGGHGGAGAGGDRLAG
jgi:DNA modification methylase